MPWPLRQGEPRVVVEIGRRRLRAVEVSGHGRRIERAVDEPMPAPDSGAGTGHEIGALLDRAGIPRGPVVLALARETVVVKRLVLAGAEPDELPEMTRLALRRELPLEDDDATIDHVPLASMAGEPSVLGVAAARRTLESQQALLAAAGRPAVRASLRLFGTAALVAAAPPQSGGSRGSRGTLVIDLTGESVELLVLIGGAQRFSRGAALDAAAGDPAAAALAEIKRTWLGYRMGSDAADAAEVDRVLVVGDLALAEALLEPLAQTLALPVERLAGAARHGSTDSHSRQQSAALPLAGLLLDDCPQLDLLHPRRAPDLAARRRQLVLGTVGLGVLAALLGYTFGARQATRDEARREEIADKARGALGEGWRLRRDADRLAHLRTWSTDPQEWLEDLIYVKELLPEPGDVVLDSVAASQEFADVKWDRAKKGDAAWSGSSEVRIALAGEAKTRAIADALREKLIADRRFNVATTGSDTRGGNRLPYPFGYLLRAQLPAQPPTQLPAPTSGQPSGAAPPPAAPAAEKAP